jgi:hypothetical protein
MTPDLPGLGDLAEIAIALSPWSASLQHVIPSALALQTKVDDVSPRELRHASGLEVQIYRNLSWTHRR